MRGSRVIRLYRRIPGRSFCQQPQCICRALASVPFPASQGEEPLIYRCVAQSSSRKGFVPLVKTNLKQDEARSAASVLVS
ncbi:hypothetical protein V5799_027080 [Amblyomma americanum]|uniref:Uncharacterized protein n=1 Tax=Amblyomma americanum TaxID=6943 RepID=A0AAQ4DGR6_AMBAM